VGGRGRYRAGARGGVVLGGGPDAAVGTSAVAAGAVCVPLHPGFAAGEWRRYFGDLRARDAAYHQGTVWAWLIGPFIDAWLKVYPDQMRLCRDFLKGFEEHVSEACIGSVSEIFDAEEPFTPRGCIAQAWSVAEVLRCYVKTTPAQQESAKA